MWLINTSASLQISNPCRCPTRAAARSFSAAPSEGASSRTTYVQRVRVARGELATVMHRRASIPRRAAWTISTRHTREPPDKSASHHSLGVHLSQPPRNRVAALFKVPNLDFQQATRRHTRSIAPDDNPRNDTPMTSQ